MVEPQYRTFGRRVGALLLDRLPFYGLEQVSGVVSSTFGSLYFGLAWGQLLGWAWITYRVLTHGVWGQTLGKKICKVRVVDLSGQRLSMKQAVLREIVPIVLNLAFVLFLSLNWEAYSSWAAGGEFSSRLATGGTVYTLAVGLWWLAQLIAVAVNEKRRAIHDFIAGSVVLRLDLQEVGPEAEVGGGRSLAWLDLGPASSRPRGLLVRAGMSLLTGLVFLAATAIPISLLLSGEGGSTTRMELLPIAGISFVWGAGAGLLLSFGISLIRTRPTKRDETAGRLFVAAVVLSGLTACLIPGCVLAFVMAAAS